jgi:hypothetical protein
MCVYVCVDRDIDIYIYTCPTKGVEIFVIFGSTRKIAKSDS